MWISNHKATLLTLLLTFLNLANAVNLQLASYGGGSSTNPEIFGYRGVETAPNTLSEDGFMRAVAAAAGQMYTRHVQLTGGVDDGFCPKAMTGVTFDRRTIYFHSSVKGAGATSVVNLLGSASSQEVRDALTRCVAAADEAERQRTGKVETNKRHINSANCGEIMATNYYTQETRRTIGTQRAPGKWIVTYASDGQTLLEPCSDTFYNVNYGCLEYVAQLGFMVCPSEEERQRQQRWAVHQQQLGRYWENVYAYSQDPTYHQMYTAAAAFYQQNGYWPEEGYNGNPTGRRKRGILASRAMTQAKVKAAVLNMLKGVCPVRKNAKLPPACPPGTIVQMEKVAGGKTRPVLKPDAKKKIKVFNCIPDPKAPKCTATQKLVDGKCVPDPKAPKCTATQELVNGKCVPKKTTSVPKCSATQELVNGKCVSKTTKTPKCTATQELVKGKCVAKCAPPKKRNTSGVCA